jgi:hypothetical protein
VVLAYIAWVWWQLDRKKLTTGDIEGSKAY